MPLTETVSGILSISLINLVYRAAPVRFEELVRQAFRVESGRQRVPDRRAELRFRRRRMTT